MQIENISNKYGTKISDIKIGECFLYKDELHMKVDIGSISFPGRDDFPNIVVNLETNKLNMIVDSVTIRRVNTKIVAE